MTRIAVDAMGGDLAPAEVVAGAAAAAERGVQVVLFGDQHRIHTELARLGATPPGLEVVHAPDAIEMGEHAARDARRRRDSSIYRGIEAVRDGAADAFVSAGNTGAVLAIGLLHLGRLPGIERPAIAVAIPVPGSEVLLLDAGANAEARAAHLVQFAHLGSSYVRIVRGIAEPRVALLNIGAEPSKGSQLTLETHAALAASGLHFIGNIEGRDLPTDAADVIVTDGFTGNVALKLAEGVIAMMLGELRREASASVRARLGGLLLRPASRRIRDRLDYRLHGAAPLLGLDGQVFIAHGSSDAAAIEHATLRAAEAVRRGVMEAIREVAGERSSAAATSAPAD